MMRPDEPTPPSRKRWLFLAAAGGLVLGLAGVYVSGWADVHSDGACEGAAATAARLKPFARGDLAGLVIADAPKDLSGLAYQTADGAPRRVADDAGRAQVLNLWATWCIPCRAEMPALDRLSAVAGAGVRVVTVNVDVGRPDKPRAFLADIGATRLPDYRDPQMRFFGDLKSRGLAFGLPTTLIVDAKGCQLAVLNGPADWDRPDALSLVNALGAL